MLTIEQLTAYGADTKKALVRCMNMPDLYLRLVRMMAQDEHLAKLRSALDARDINTAFEEAHALKGVLANLELTPVLTPVSEVTEMLRPRGGVSPALTPEDEQNILTRLLPEAEQEMNRLLALING